MSFKESSKNKILVYVSTLIFGVLIFFSALSFYKSGSIPIIFTSDVHSHVDDYIGYPRLSTIVQDIKRSNINKSPILVDVGDTFSGSTEVTKTEGNYILDILNTLPYSLMCLGNHDFDYGVKGLKKLADRLNFPTVTTNILYEDSLTPLFNPYWVISYKTNLFRVKKVGFISFLTPATKRKNLKSKTDSVIFSTSMEQLQKTVDNLRKTADIVVLLSHTDSLEFSSPKIIDHEDIEGSLENILKKVSGIDLVIAGHTHTTPQPDLKINGVPVFHVGEYMQYIGILKITESMFSSGFKVSSQYIDQSSALSYQKDPKVVEKINKLQKEFQDKYYKIIAHSNVDLSYNKKQQGLKQVKLTTYVNDALREQTGADIVLNNAGGIRSGVKKGDMTLNDIISILPYGNTAELVVLSGKELKQILEISNSLYPESAPSYLQYSSNMVVNVDNKNDPYNRIKSITINGKKVKDSDSFTVLLSNYLLEGKDGYDVLKNKESIKNLGVMDELLSKYIVTHSPINF